MTARPVAGCPRPAREPETGCWHHAALTPAERTQLGRDLGLHPNTAAVMAGASAGLVWSDLAATLHGALDTRSRPDP